MLSVAETVEVTEGKNSVLLPFKSKVHLPEDVTVEWRRSGSINLLVHKSQNGQHQQDQIYQGRTEMNEDALRTCNLSLTLKDIQLNDQGVYTCVVYRNDGEILTQKVVTLRVKGQCKSCFSRV